MAYIGNNPKYNTATNNPQSSDPINPTEGMQHYSDGTARAEGIYIYKNGDWVRLVEGEAGNLFINTVSTTYTVTAGDSVVLCDATAATFTVTLPTAVGNSGKVYYIKKIDISTNAITIEGDGAETIDDIANFSLVTQYDTLNVVSNGVNWETLSTYKKEIIIDPAEMIRLNTQNGRGSVNTPIRRFLNTVSDTTSNYIQYTDSVASGSSFTALQDCWISISYSENFSVINQFGLTLNGTFNTTAFNNVPISEKLAWTFTSASNFTETVSWTGPLQSGDIIRCHTEIADGQADRCIVSVAARSLT